MTSEPDDESGISTGAITEPKYRRAGCGIRYDEDELREGIDFSAASSLRDATQVALTFRCATRDDATAVADLVNRAYRGEESRKGWTTEADLLGGQRIDAAMILEFMESSFFRLAYDGEALVGSMHVEVLDQERAELGMLAVAPERQDQGIGRQLLEEGEHFIRDELELDGIRMRVLHQRESLIRWYERNGYHRTDSKSPFPTSPRFGEPRVKDLWFVVLEKSLSS